MIYYSSSSFKRNPRITPTPIAAIPIPPKPANQAAHPQSEQSPKSDASQFRRPQIPILTIPSPPPYSQQREPAYPLMIVSRILHYRIRWNRRRFRSGAFQPAPFDYSRTDSGNLLTPPPCPHPAPTSTMLTTRTNAPNPSRQPSQCPHPNGPRPNAFSQILSTARQNP